MIQKNTNFGQLITEVIHDTYGRHFKIYDSRIPLSIRAAETSAYGKSLFAFEPSNRAAQAYKDFSYAMAGKHAQHTA